MSRTTISEPTIAVIVPNRNDARYLSHCIRSVLEQDVAPDELVVIDDQSTDNSVTIAANAIKLCPYARLIENPVNLGVYGAIDVGLQHCSSKYVFFLAANDYVLPGIFARAKACLARVPGAGVWSALAWSVDEYGRLIRLHPSPVVSLQDAYLSPPQCVKLAHRLGNWFTGTTLIYRRDALDEAGRFDRAFMGLADLFTALIIACRHGAAYSPAPYAAIRKHEGSYLAKTLADPAMLEDIVRSMFARGQPLVPQLFTPEFASLTLKRFRFSSIRESSGATIGAVADRCSGATAQMLRYLDLLLPGTWSRMRALLAFLLLRPFDILPTLRYRMLGWVYVRVRSRWVPPE